MGKFMASLIVLGAGWAAPAAAEVDYAARLKQGDVILRDFTFADGEKLAEMRIHYANPWNAAARQVAGGSSMR